MKGTMTIEAAYLFPFCFMIIGLVCMLGIYQYNEAVLQMTGYECILQTMEEHHLEEDLLEEKLFQMAEEKGKARIFGAEGLKIDLKVTDSYVSLTYRVTQNVIGVPLTVRVVYQRTHPERTLRLTERLTGEGL